MLNACRKLGVETKPSVVDGLGIIPLYSWYHEVKCSNALLYDVFSMDLNHLFIVYDLALFQSFDEERDITGIRIPSLEMVINFLSPSKDFISLSYLTAHHWNIGILIKVCVDMLKDVFCVTLFWIGQLPFLVLLNLIINDVIEH